MSEKELADEVIDSTKIVGISSIDEKISWGKFTDINIYISQGDNEVVLTPKLMRKLEKVVGAKFKV